MARSSSLRSTSKKVRFGGTPKPTLGTSVLPGFPPPRKQRRGGSGGEQCAGGAAGGDGVGGCLLRCLGECAAAHGFGAGVGGWRGDVCGECGVAHGRRGRRVQPGGSKHVVWNAGADWDGQFSAQMRFQDIESSTLHCGDCGAEHLRKEKITAQERIAAVDVSGRSLRKFSRGVPDPDDFRSRGLTFAGGATVFGENPIFSLPCFQESS